MFKKLMQLLFGSSNDEELRRILSENHYLIDVRTESEFKSGSVKGAINIPLGLLNSQLDKLKNKQNIIVFCASGMRSAQAKNILSKNGINSINIVSAL